MNVTSIAEYLITQAGKAAASLQQQNKNNTNQGVVRPLRDKSGQQTADASRTSVAVSPSSAYRVTLSAAAMQKIAVG
ncbi:MAG: hypothetical protein HQL87_05040 [Magnetococcales bacterium]|nr:hypothetical protein [Magnetococcales bacterium]